MIHLREALEQEGAWVDIEKPFWWDMPTWVATGKVQSIGLANNHMLPQGNVRRTRRGGGRGIVGSFRRLGETASTRRAIYYRLLNCGIRIPPSAGSASGVLAEPRRLQPGVCPSSTARSLTRHGGSGLGAGRSFVTNGPILLVEANGKSPGHVFRVQRGASMTIDTRRARSEEMIRWRRSR